MSEEQVYNLVRDYAEFMDLQRSEADKYTNVTTVNSFYTMKQARISRVEQQVMLEYINKYIKTYSESMEEFNQDINVITETLLSLYAKTGIKCVLHPELLRVLYNNMKCVNKDVALNKLFGSSCIIDVGPKRRLFEDAKFPSVDCKEFAKLYNKSCAGENEEVFRGEHLGVMDVKDYYEGGTTLAEEFALYLNKVVASPEFDGLPERTCLTLCEGLVSQDAATLLQAYYEFVNEHNIESDLLYAHIIAVSLAKSYVLNPQSARVLTGVDTHNTYSYRQLAVPERVAKKICLYVPEVIDEDTELWKLQETLINYSKDRGIPIFDIIDDVRRTAPDMYKDARTAELLQDMLEPYMKVHC